MPPPTDDEAIQKEGRLLIAKQAIELGQFRSVLSAAKTYNVSKDTLKRRRAGVTARRDRTPNSMKLTKIEEEAIIKHIIELDLRRFSPSYPGVADMANYLLAARGRGTVSQRWPYNFVNRSDRLKSRFNRRLDYQRAQCEDPKVINDWFSLVQNTRLKYGITDADIYNFNETGFQMGVIASKMVITGADRRGRPKAIQPGNREWVTVIQGIGGGGWAIPPFIIFAGQYHLSTWFSKDIPPN
jgi:hypothetical protein